MARLVIWSAYRLKIYEVFNETPQRIYGQIVRTERYEYGQKWIDKRQVIAEVTHEDWDKAVEEARALISKIEDIYARRDAEELEVRKKYHEEYEEAREPYRFKPQVRDER